MRSEFCICRGFSYELSGVVRVSVILTVLLFLGSRSPAVGCVPQMSNIVATDVSPVSFSVIWTCSEPSTCDLNVSADPSGMQPVDDITILSMPVENGDTAIVQKAEDN